MYISGYRCMWIIVLFDLPTDTKVAKRQYTNFRKTLLDDGFGMMQYSVYYRHCASKENTEVHLERIRQGVPPDGEVRLIQLTDKQFERMEVFFGKRRTKTEEAPAQLEMF
ncbi:CRISPR-associated endonuclease Cas2 [Akkermansiaceae bacterium]|nr:CRISPR-associated endonuclease Cas2 [Akkermansiaceae bacterium]